MAGIDTLKFPFATRCLKMCVMTQGSGSESPAAGTPSPMPRWSLRAGPAGGPGFGAAALLPEVHPAGTGWPGRAKSWKSRAGPRVVPCEG